MEKMAGVLLKLLALWTCATGMAQSCPLTCNCQEKSSKMVVDCNNKDLLEVPDGFPIDATTVSLTANKIKGLTRKSFTGLPQVTSLWMSHNDISSIEVGTFTPVTHLRNMDISHNNIVDFPWEDLRNLTSLQLLKMNNNKMVTLPKDALATLQELKSLRINNNKFATIAEGTFSVVASLSHIQIFSNPFTCSCNMEWLRDWILTTTITVPEPNLIVCEAPELLRGVMVSKIPKMSCEAPSIAITSQPNLDNAQLHKGTFVVLNCETKGSPIPQVSWEVTAGGQSHLFPLPSSGELNDLPVNIEAAGSGMLVFRNGSLVIPSLSKKEDGQYSCRAVNELGQAQRSVAVTLTEMPKRGGNLIPDSTVDKIRPSDRKPMDPQISKNNVINWGKQDENVKSDSGGKSKYMEGTGGLDKNPIGSKCGIKDSSEYISNHAFNLTLDNLKQYTFDFGVIAIEVSETEAKVQLNPLQFPRSKSNLQPSETDNQATGNKEPAGLLQSSSNQGPLDVLYLCINTGNGHSIVQWSNIEEGVNSYLFHGLQPGTNYTLCLTYGGQDCQVQVVFTTRKRIPSLLIIVVVSVFLLGLATVPLLGATCCHLLYKYQGKTYKFVMKAQNPDLMEREMTRNVGHRASFVESEKTFDPSETEEEGAERDPEAGADGSVVTESIPCSSSKTNQEEFEMGSEYSDRLPLGAEAVNISEEINGNYNEPGR